MICRAFPPMKRDLRRFASPRPGARNAICGVSRLRVRVRALRSVIPPPEGRRSRFKPLTYASDMGSRLDSFGIGAQRRIPRQHATGPDNVLHAGAFIVAGIAELTGA